ncbi:TPA: hypothetical protein NGR37_003519 [Vibrio parahaemolyticus]|nr:hypothetical protein [Vibrio parahaemolyticus]HCE3505873.1 hypothetical protein [Vibrio parahaemolyticus]HCE3652057.1 hypothetical protein [Vibrio parahaemolyticus]
MKTLVINNEFGGGYGDVAISLYALIELINSAATQYDIQLYVRVFEHLELVKNLVELLDLPVTVLDFQGYAINSAIGDIQVRFEISSPEGFPLNVSVIDNVNGNIKRIAIPDFLRLKDCYKSVVPILCHKLDVPHIKASCNKTLASRTALFHINDHANRSSRCVSSQYYVNLINGMYDLGLVDRVYLTVHDENQYVKDLLPKLIPDCTVIEEPLRDVLTLMREELPLVVTHSTGILHLGALLGCRTIELCPPAKPEIETEIWHPPTCDCNHAVYYDMSEMEVLCDVGQWE